MNSEKQFLEESTKNLSMNQIENSIKFKLEIEIKECTILSNYFGEEANNQQSIYLPTPESLFKLINNNSFKEIVKYDQNKYNSIFNRNNNSKNNTENTGNNLDSSLNDTIILDMNKLTFIPDVSVLSLILVFLGGINTQTDIYIIFPNEVFSENPDKSCFIDNSANYEYYIYNIIQYLKKQQINFPYSYFNSLFECLEEIGIYFLKDIKSVLYSNIKDSFMSLIVNKILIILAPSNNFWLKSEKNVINNENYDKKLNNYCNIFYNKTFIKKFLTLIGKHPRCNICLISSMTKNNLKETIDGLDIEINKLLPQKFSVISQGEHDVIKSEKGIPKFFRNMEKIIQHLKLKDKWDFFDEENIIIIEGDKNKITEGTSKNTLVSNFFCEENFISGQTKKEEIERNGDKIIKYLLNLLENCVIDIREYLIKNPYSEFKV